MTTASTSLGGQNYHRDPEATINPQINLELHASCIYLSISYYFNCNDVALKKFAKYVLHQSHKEREHTEKLMKQNQRGDRIFLQDIKKPHCEDWENGLNAMECALHLKARIGPYRSYINWQLTKQTTDFVETHYLNEQVKSIKKLRDYKNNLGKMGAREIWHRKVSV